MSFGLMPRRAANKASSTSPMFEMFQDELNRLFDAIGQEFPEDFSQMRNSALPAARVHSVKIDLKDAGEELILTADLPGVELGDITLAVTPHYASLSGERKSETSEHDEHHYRMERGHGFFRRVIPMPCEVDKDRVDAVFKDGVLRISLPKTKQAKDAEKKISVKAG